MRRKIALFLFISCVCVCLTGCQNKHDKIEIWNQDDLIFDDINIDIKDGYFYDSHEKFTVDDNTVAVTIYFKNSEIDEWDSK